MWRRVAVARVAPDMPGAATHLGGLRLAGAGGPGGRAAELEVHGAHQRQVAAVRQRRDHQPPAASHNTHYNTPPRIAHREPRLAQLA